MAIGLFVQQSIEHLMFDLFAFYFQNRYNRFKSANLLKEGFPITEPHFYAHINEQELRHIFRSDSSVQIPLFELRLKILQETGRILNEVL